MGRLAPSPTGRMHIGNLSTSLLAWVQARHDRGRVILRIEDLDPPRTVPDADQWIVDDLRWLGIDWDDGPDHGGAAGPYYQSARTAIYDAALARLLADDRAYPCICSRREVEELLSAPHSGFDSRTRYPGTCARMKRPVSGEAAIRFRAAGAISVRDGIQPPLTHDLAIEPGDFVIRRRDGLYAYQLAVVIDDAAMGVTDVVRGHDLLDSTPRQLALFDALGSPRPRTWHVPLLVDEGGARLSKRARATARPGLEALGWTAPALIGTLCKLWGWSDDDDPRDARDLVALWNPAALRRETLPVPRWIVEAGPPRRP